MWLQSLVVVYVLTPDLHKGNGGRKCTLLSPLEETVNKKASTRNRGKYRWTLEQLQRRQRRKGGYLPAAWKDGGTTSTLGNSLLTEKSKITIKKRRIQRRHLQVKETDRNKLLFWEEEDEYILIPHQLKLHHTCLNIPSSKNITILEEEGAE